MHNLAPVALEHDGLPQALKSTVAEWGERTGIRAEFTVTGTAEHLHDEVSATLLRIAQEALSNASRHAHATRLGVTLSFMGDEVVLDIRDDGRGFDPLAARERTTMRRLRTRRHACPRRTHRRSAHRRVRARARHGAVRSRTVGPP